VRQRNAPVPYSTAALDWLDPARQPHDGAPAVLAIPLKDVASNSPTAFKRACV